MNLSQLITGIVAICLGSFLIVLSFFTDVFWVSLTYGLVIFVVGLFILFNSKEDKIEQIKKRKRR